MPELKNDVTDMNLKELAVDFAELLEKHLGGEFKADVIGFTQIEHEGPGLAGFGEEFEVRFRIKDKTHLGRTMHFANR